MAYKFSAEKADKLEKQERYKFFKPEEQLPKVGMHEGQTVLDVGCGTGFYTRVAASVVGPTGNVTGLDILPEMIEEAQSRGIPENVTLELSKESEFPVGCESMDWVIMTNLFHELEDPDKFISEIRRVLKSGGHVYLTDWRPLEEDEGPPKEHRVEPSLVVEAFERHQFSLVSKETLGKSHCEIVFEK